MTTSPGIGKDGRISSRTRSRNCGRCAGPRTASRSGWAAAPRSAEMRCPTGVSTSMRERAARASAPRAIRRGDGHLVGRATAPPSADRRLPSDRVYHPASASARCGRSINSCRRARVSRRPPARRPLCRDGQLGAHAHRDSRRRPSSSRLGHHLHAGTVSGGTSARELDAGELRLSEPVHVRTRSPSPQGLSVSGRPPAPSPGA